MELERLVTPDPGLPILDVAWSADALIELFNHPVVAACWPGHEIVGVRRKKVGYKPGNQCAILCALRFAHAPAEESQWAVVTFAGEDVLEGVYEQHYRKPRKSTRPDALLLSEYGCLVEFFPFDWRLRPLRHATDRNRVASVMPDGSPASSSAKLVGPDVSVPNYRPHEGCVLLYTRPVNGGAAPPCVGKLYPERTDARRAWHALETLLAADARIQLPTGCPAGRGLEPRVDGADVRDFDEERAPRLPHSRRSRGRHESRGSGTRSPSPHRLCEQWSPLAGERARARAGPSRSDFARAASACCRDGCASRVQRRNKRGYGCGRPEIMSHLIGAVVYPTKTGKISVEQLSEMTKGWQAEDLSALGLIEHVSRGSCTRLTPPAKL